MVNKTILLYTLLFTLYSFSHRDLALDGGVTLIALQDDIGHLEVTDIVHLWVEAQSGQ